MFEDFFDEMKRFQREINKCFGNFLEENYKLLPADNEKRLPGMRFPLTDLVETDTELIAKFEIPGVNKKDIQLNVSEDRIEVKAEKKQEVKIEKKGFYKEERSFSGFYRSVPLPSKVIPDKAVAKYEDGILEVIVPKIEKKKQKKIEIN